jgi:hypothetical protein
MPWWSNWYIYALVFAEISTNPLLVYSRYYSGNWVNSKDVLWVPIEHLVHKSAKYVYRVISTIKETNEISKSRLKVDNILWQGDQEWSLQDRDLWADI